MTVTAGGVLVGRVAIPGVEQLAVSAGWLVARATGAGGRQILLAAPLPG
ncbi:MAG: hypothetical protein ACR2KV_11395 [Solirubrobacteraceae bacterium]